MKVIFNRNQVAEAAKFICAHNKAAPTWEDVQADPVKLAIRIVCDIVDKARQPETRYIMSGGWIIVFDRDPNLDFITADVFVDPSVGIDLNLMDDEEVQL